MWWHSNPVGNLCAPLAILHCQATWILHQFDRRWQAGLWWPAPSPLPARWVFSAAYIHPTCSPLSFPSSKHKCTSY